LLGFEGLQRTAFVLSGIIALWVQYSNLRTCSHCSARAPDSNVEVSNVEVPEGNVDATDAEAAGLPLVTPPPQR
jgi:hypothetical protein